MQPTLSDDMLTDDVRDAFWANVDKAGDCWTWGGVLSSHGYGRFRIRSWPYPAHRVALMLSGRKVPVSQLVDHVCFNHACVRPDHLRMATHKQNAEHREGANRGAQVPYRGVYFNPRMKSRPYYVKVKHLGKQYSGGHFTSAEEAEVAAQDLRLRLFTHER